MAVNMAVLAERQCVLKKLVFRVFQLCPAEIQVNCGVCLADSRGPFPTCANQHTEPPSAVPDGSGAKGSSRGSSDSGLGQSQRLGRVPPTN